jgi:hypothetical protein
MLDEKSGLWAQIVGLFPEQMRPQIGMALAMLVIALASYGAIFAPIAIIGWATKPKVEECWELKQTGDTFVRFNKCTGEMKPADLPKPEPKAKG